MAESILLSALLPVLFEKSASLINRQLRKVLGAQVEREVGKLRSVLSTVQAVLRHTEIEQLKDDLLRNWLAKLKDVAYNADDLLEDFNLEIERRRAENRNSMKEKVRRFLFRMKMARMISEIVERFDLLAAEKDKFHLTPAAGELPVSRDYRPQTHSYVCESDVVGRKEDVEEIVKLLIDQEQEISVLPIVGMGGLGKTTLAQMVYNQSKVADHFQLRIWVCVSNNFDTATIVRAILESVTEEVFLILDMDPLQRRLQQVIGGQRYLLVLDDVWNEQEQRWNELRVLLNFGGKGSAVIVTTRSDRVASIVGTLNPYRLAELSNNLCWDLFKRIAFSGAVEASPDMIAIGKKIVQKCGGLPLAVTLLGGLMRHKSEKREWRAMESELWDLTIEQSGILPVLMLSYTHLRPHVKQCLAFCTIFPKGHLIEENVLIELWMANGFIPSDTRMELELTAHEIFQELVSRSLFQDVEEGAKSCKLVTTCRMHDLVHDLVQSIMRNECRILDMGKDWYGNKNNLKELTNSTTRHISLTREDMSYLDGSHYPYNMRTHLLLGTVRECTGTTREHMISYCRPSSYPANRYLRVLDLSDTAIYMLPISICNLRHLRYLDISQNNMETLPKSIGHLFNLQTLKLDHCQRLRVLPEAICKLFNLQTLKLDGCEVLGELPKGLGNMRNLKHLTLLGCEKIRSMPVGMGRLRCLQTLTFYVAGGEVGSGSIGELKDLDLHGVLELQSLENVRNVAEAGEANFGLKENINKLVLQWGSALSRANEPGNAEEVLEALRPHQGLKMLKIQEYHGIKFPTWLQENPLLNLVEIKLYDCHSCEHLPLLGQLQFLEHLRIGRMPSVKHIGGTTFYSKGVAESSASVFPSLRVFSLDHMDNLEEWSGVIGRPSFPRLVNLEVKKCPSIQYLYLGHCPLLRPANGFFRYMASLATLSIDSCDKLTLMLEQDDVVGLTYLQDLVISYCHQQIFSLPSLGLWKHLNFLQDLRFTKCDGLISLPAEVIQGLSSLRNLQIEGCCNLICSTSLSSSPSTSIGGGLHLQYLTALEVLAISGCEELTTLPVFPASLQEVIISHCHSISSLPEGLGCLTTLRCLRLEGLPNLAALPVGLRQRLPNLTELYIMDCPDVVKWFMMGEDLHLVSSIPDVTIGSADGRTSYQWQR